MCMPMPQNAQRECTIVLARGGQLSDEQAWDGSGVSTSLQVDALALALAGAEPCKSQAWTNGAVVRCALPK